MVNNKEQKIEILFVEDNVLTEKRQDAVMDFLLSHISCQVKCM